MVAKSQVEAQILKIEIQRIANETQPLIQKVQQLSTTEAIAERFQARQSSLMLTMDKTEGYAKIRIVILGLGHVEQPKELENDSRFSIEPLKDYLKDKKCVVLKHNVY